MKKLLVLLLVIVLSVLSLNACVDPDEAMPHYQMTAPVG